MFNDRRDGLPTSEDLFAGIARPSASDVIAAPLAAVSQALRRRRKHVKSFEEAASAAGPLSSYPLGLRTVEVRRIVGSVGRAAELGRDFLPLDAQRKMTSRLRRIIQAMENGVELPPLDLYKLKTEYYVLDGNHRVAAARRLGQLYLDAIVTEFIPLRDAHDNDVFMARQRFERATGLTSVAATEREHFRELYRMIQAYHEQRRAQGEPKLTLKDAAYAWYHSVYVPIADAVRHTRLPRAFPDRRAGDFFVYIDEYIKREKARGRTLGWQDALAELVGYYAGQQRRLPRLGALLGRPPQEGQRARRRTTGRGAETAPEDPLGILVPHDENIQAEGAMAIPFLPGATTLGQRAPLLHRLADPSAQTEQGPRARRDRKPRAIVGVRRPTDLSVPLEEGPQSGEEPTPPPMGLL